MFTDNRGFEWGATGIYQRKHGAEAELLKLKGAKIPADVHISTDGQILYYVDYGHNPSRIFRAFRQGDSWQKPTIDERFPEGAGYLSSTQGGVFYFHRNGDIHRLEGDTVTTMPKSINSVVGEFDPFIAQDESFLIVVRQDGEGDSNMYLSVKNKSGWSELEKLPAPFNASKIDGSPYVSPDKQYLFWSSNRDGEVLKTWQAPIYSYLQSKLSS